MADEFGLLARQRLTCGQQCTPQSRPAGKVRRRSTGSGRGCLSIITALSANSPYWRGRRTPTSASYRTVVWGQWPTAGPTEIFGDAVEL